MTTKSLSLRIALPLAAVGAVALIYYSNSELKSRLAETSQNAGAEVPRQTRVTHWPGEADIVRPKRSADELQALARVHVNALQESLRKTNAATSATLQLEGDTSASEQASREMAEMEKSLQDAMANLTRQMLLEPDLTTGAVALLQAQNDPEMMLMIARAIGEAAAALGDQFPYDLLLEMAENDPSKERRRAALFALGYMTRIPGELEQRVTEISRTSSSNDVRIAAIMSMGSWMSRNRELTGRITEALLPARETSDDPMVRGMVIQTIGNMDSPLTPKVFEAMADAISSEQEPTNRTLAALALGGGVSPDNRESVVAVLRDAYLMEPTLEGRRHILTQITKATRDTTHLQGLPTPDPVLAQDVEDFNEILASVDRSNWDAIWTEKSHRNDQRGTYPSSHGGHGSDLD